MTLVSDKTQKGKMPKSLKSFFRPYWRAALIWSIIAGIIVASIFLRWDKKVVAAVVIVFGLATQAFGGAIALIGAVPIIGPLIVKAITLPFILLVNGIGYLVTFFALRRGYKIDVMKSRVLISSFLVGVILGFVLGRLI
ncbi:hypothetical protein E3J38_05365 [candidate division TA06 bacterium]|uniref:Uncharacterized protein n=1 Tax=candidate division TA06 bacterium TaxID=2250710 RepID=A0A523XMQ2_UNCT6|nr:MAG: hypothetical protein E3J38_05365 [candidate division TA06 bacterium]